MTQTKLQQNLWQYTGKKYQPHSDFWRSQLAQIETPFVLEGSLQTGCFCQDEKEIYHLELDESTTQTIEAIAKQDLLGIYVVVASAIAYLLSRYTGQSTVLIDSPFLAVPKPSEAIEEQVSLIVQVNQTHYLKSFISEFSQIVSQSYSYQSFPYRQMIATDRTKENLTTNVIVWLPKIHGSCSGLNRYDWGIEIHKEAALSLTWHYNPRRFDRFFVQSFGQHLQNLLSVYTHRDTPLANLEILSPDEKTKLLGDWAVGDRIEQKEQTIHEMFADQVLKTPENIAIQTPSQGITYQELDFQANQLAHYLHTQYNIKPDEPIGVMIGRSDRLIIGLLAILKAGGTYVPIDPDNFSDRLEFIIRDADIKVLLMELENLPQLQNLLDIPMFAMDVQLQELDSSPPHPPLSLSQPSDLAYIIYTSGSTGTPKGVMIEHQSFVNMAIAQIDAFGIQQTDRVLQFANSSFDASLSEIFMALFSGAAVVLVDKATIADRQQFLAYLDTQKVTVATFPPAYLRALEQPNFQYLRVMITAGETAQSVDAHHYAQRLDYFNAYGPTETSVCATIYKLNPENTEIVPIPIGKPIPNTGVYLLDQLLRPVPTGVVGEICVVGKGLARGYLHNLDLTASKFVENPFAPGEKLYRTGDFAKRLPSGELIFLGRQDRQVKIRGYRIELGEIEVALCQLRQIAQAVALSRIGNDGNQEIVAYVVGEPGLDSSQLRADLSEILPEYMIPAVFVLLSELPLTPNGKIDHRALPAPDTSNRSPEASFDPPCTPTEEILAALWAEVLGLERVGIHDNFFEIGGHSLLATQLISRIRDTLSVEIPQRSLFETPTIAELSSVVESLRQTGLGLHPLAIAPINKNGNLPLSFAQQRLWFLDQLEEGSATYNISVALRLIGSLDVAALEMAVQEIVRRHEVLRTSFATKDGTAVSAIAPTFTVTVPIVDLQMLADEQSYEVQRLATIEEQLPFDLTSGTLLRVTLLRLTEESHVLLVTMHHIVSDAWSIGIFIREMAALYEAFSQGKPSPLPELSIQYADFAHWQRQLLSQEVLEVQLNYWRQQLAVFPPLLELPTDRIRPPVQTFQGDIEYFQLDRGLTQKLQTLSQKSGTTLFMTLLAAFATFLGRYSNQEDILVGSPIANRNRRETESLIGFFVNSLVLRADLQGNPTFQQLLNRIRQVAMDAYTHQDLPFEQLVEALQPERSLSYSPLFQVMFVLHNTPMGKLEIPGLTLTPLKNESATAKFDLTLVMEETEQGLSGEWEYNTDLFDAATIARMARHFQNLLAVIVANPEQRISEFCFLEEVERQQLLVNWNHTQTEYPPCQCIHQMLEAQVEKTPNAIALEFTDAENPQQLTYWELNARANQLAHYLQKLGVGPEVLVGICMERSLLMVVALLGILKAGGAYVPLDPQLPQERLAFILEDAQVSVLLTQERLQAGLPNDGRHLVCLDTICQKINQESQENLLSGVTVANLAYAIYTSGSTGKPKGVEVTHQSVANFLNSLKQQPGLTEQDILLAVTTISFDIAGLELFLPLIVGAKLSLTSDEEASDGARLLEKLIKSQATVIQATPATYRMLEAAGWKTSPQLKILCGGEALPQTLAEKLREKAASVWNLYGPTEATIWSTIYNVSPAVNPNKETLEPIGRPIANTQIYILDRNLQPVPIGVRGELYIGGAGLARGYLARPDLTAEKFIPNPFSNELGSRLYKTGDLARYLPDGNIEYLGRIDHQVKLRGFRIELGEIEAVLRQHPQIRESAVIIREDQPNQKRLVGYVVSNTESIDTSEIRRFLSEKLPDYMLPNAFVQMEALPLTPNGKCDRRALPAPGATVNLAATFVAPSTSTEKILADIWAKVLGLEQVSIYNNFFELGGDSIVSIQVIAQAHQAGLQLTLKQLFQHQTVAELACVLDTTISTPSQGAIATNPVPLIDRYESGDTGDYQPSDFPLAKLDEEKLKKISSLFN